MSSTSPDGHEDSPHRPDQTEVQPSLRRPACRSSNRRVLVRVIGFHSLRLRSGQAIVVAVVDDIRVLTGFLIAIAMGVSLALTVLGFPIGPVGLLACLVGGVTLALSRDEATRRHARWLLLGGLVMTSGPLAYVLLANFNRR